MKKFISYLIFYLVQFTWGILLNIFGILVALFMLLTFHKPHLFGPSIYFICKKAEGFGFEAGIFFVVGSDCEKDELIMHECGHGIQNMIFGIFTPFIISIPSMIRYWYREIKYYNKGKLPPTEYDAIWFEGQATRWGEKYYMGCYEKLIEYEGGK